MIPAKTLRVFRVMLCRIIFSLSLSLRMINIPTTHHTLFISSFLLSAFSEVHLVIIQSLTAIALVLPHHNRYFQSVVSEIAGAVLDRHQHASKVRELASTGP